MKWKDFVKVICIRFRPTGYMDYDEALSRVKQTDSLREYQREFERIATRVRWPEKALVGTFIGGLKNDLAREVKVCKPKTLLAAIEYAHLRDEHLNDVKKEWRTDPKIPPVLQSDYRPSIPRGENVPSKNVGKPLPVGVNKLSWEEMQKKREKGLCFNCDEKFTQGHRCKISQVYLIEPVEEDSVDEEPEEGLTTTSEDPLISVHAMAGTKGPRTMRLKAWVYNQEVTILIDNGSSHNFINSIIAERLQLPCSSIEAFDVKVASGETLSCSEVYCNVPIKIQEIHIHVDLFALPLVGLDIVLGIQWLARLGKIISDYGKMTMEFEWGDGWVKLSSQPALETKLVGVNAIEKLWCHGG